MNIVTQEPKSPESNLQRSRLTAVELVARVAARHVESAVKAHPHGTPLFAILGLDKELTCAIARKIAGTIASAQVFVHEALSDGSLPPALLTRASTGHFRNMPRGSGGVCIVFATPTQERDYAGLTAGEIHSLSEGTLSELPELWIEACPELSTTLPPRNDLRNFLAGLHKSGLVVGGLKMLGQFVVEVETAFQGMSIERAIDEALPALHIPRNAGRFKDVGERGKLRSADKWAETLKEIHQRTEDAIYLKNDRGTALDRTHLRKEVDRLETADKLSDAEAATLRNLLDDTTVETGRWRPSQDAVVRLSWDKISPIFKARKAVAKEPLGSETLKFFTKNFSRELSKEEKDWLNSVKDDEAPRDIEQEKEFFFQRRDHICEDKNLLKRWESFVFPKNDEFGDLLSGLLSTIADIVHVAPTKPQEPRIFVRLVGADKKAFWKSHNTDLCRYLRDRYRGLVTVLGEVGVILDFGICWSSGEQNWDDAATDNTKTGTTSRQFKFDLFLLDASDFADNGLPPDAVLKSATSRQLLWSLPANSLASAFSGNLLDLFAAAERQPLPIGSFTRGQSAERFVDEIIDLENRGSIQDVHSKTDGILVDPNLPLLDAAALFLDGVESLTGHVLSPASAERLKDAFAAFRTKYWEAITAIVSGNGLASESLFEQAQLFGALLSLLRRDARKDECRKKLWETALSIGLAFSSDKPMAVISTPWHPFRLAEAAAKAKRTANAVARMVDKSTPMGADIETFAETVITGIEAPWHPSIAVRFDEATCRMFVESDSVYEFSLLESPTGGDGRDAAFDGYSKQAASELLAVANEYLGLQPHERANFSIALFNADNRDLPARLAERLARKIETEADLRCDLILTHSDQQSLRQIYAEQNVAISRELDGALASEAAQSFLSRLRVGFLDADAVSQSMDGRPRVDIVFLHDVIARSAKLAWRRVEEPAETYADLVSPNGEASSRRRPFEIGSRKTEVFLVAAERPKEVQEYLDLVHDLHLDDQDDQRANFAPVREIVFDDANVGQVIAKAHQVGNWVVTFDAVADFQLLRNNDVNIIRFLTRPGLQHNVIVSTKRHARTLTSRITEIIGPISDLNGEKEAALAKLFIDEAARISGKVVLHAARNETNAFELVGLVLSRRLVADAISEVTTPVAWLLLDDFGGWISHPSGKRADILVVALGEQDGRLIVDLVVVESKFVGIAAETSEAKEALTQLRASTNHVRDRLVLDKDALNRPTWLAHLADLVLEHGDFDQAIAGLDAATWAGKLRSNEAILRVRGAAFVFTHDRYDGKGEPMPSGLDEQKEYIFDRSDISRMMARLHDPEANKKFEITLPPPVSSDGSSETETMAEQRAPETSAPVAEPEQPAPAPTFVEPVSPAAPRMPERAGAGRLPPSVERFVDGRAASQSDAAGEAWLAETEKRLRVALRGYSLDADIVESRLTPNAALVRFKGTDRMTVSEVERKREVLLTSHRLDVIGVRPEKGEVAVMVARETRAVLDLCSLWQRRQLLDTVPTENTSFLLGEREIDGSLLYLNLGGPFAGQPQHGPHTLIAGETGGGKGVLTRNLILDICATNSPDNARIRMIDPKSGGDYPWIERLPHLDGGLVSSQEEAQETLRNLVDEMERRYAIITKVTSNIDRYNAKVSPAQRLPRIYLFHDELGDWMADKDHEDYREAVESYIVRLASKARAAGIHLFLITQRPDKDALPGQVKANMNNKVCLRVSSQTNSRIVLDENGAETLLGNGHFAAKLANERPSNQTSLILAQAPFLDDDAAFDLADAIRDHWIPR
jgi:S-DNA-T family DNA segregation ATPase FtsK/SpoIIIE